MSSCIECPGQGDERLDIAAAAVGEEKDLHGVCLPCMWCCRPTVTNDLVMSLWKNFIYGCEVKTATFAGRPKASSERVRWNHVLSTVWAITAALTRLEIGRPLSGVRVRVANIDSLHLRSGRR